jgi:hypothetical protein
MPGPRSGRRQPSVARDVLSWGRGYRLGRDDDSHVVWARSGRVVGRFPLTGEGRQAALRRFERLERERPALLRLKIPVVLWYLAWWVLSYLAFLRFDVCRSTGVDPCGHRAGTAWVVNAVLQVAAAAVTGYFQERRWVLILGGLVAPPLIWALTIRF